VPIIIENAEVVSNHTDFWEDLKFLNITELKA
jgi:hypothetical protein